MYTDSSNNKTNPKTKREKMSKFIFENGGFHKVTIEAESQEKANEIYESIFGKPLSQ